MSESNREFFVGYLKTPKRLANFYRLLIPLTILLSLAAGYWMASSQKTVGDGVWHNAQTETISGYLTVAPYPIMHFVGVDKRSVILVLPGKHSADEAVKKYSNQWIKVTGYRIDRGGWSMLEIAADTSITTTTAVGDAVLSDIEQGEVTLQGEIVDSKCFLGVMKPGAGKAHRACAALCLRGGLPPMLVVKNKASEQYGYLLMQQDGASAATELARLAAIPVSVTGTLIRRGDLTYIRYLPGGIRVLANDRPVQLSQR